MNTNTILQVPIDKSFRDEVSAIAKNMGFSSLQDLVRFTLFQIKNQTIVPSLVNTSIRLSPKAQKRYTKMADDIDNGIEKTLKFKNTKEMFDYLNDPNRASP